MTSRRIPFPSPISLFPDFTPEVKNLLQNISKQIFVEDMPSPKSADFIFNEENPLNLLAVRIEFPDDECSIFSTDILFRDGNVKINFKMFFFQELIKYQPKKNTLYFILKIFKKKPKLEKISVDDEGIPFFIEYSFADQRKHIIVIDNSSRLILQNKEELQNFFKIICPE